MREIIFDTETTGFDPKRGDRITEIGCVETIDFIPTGRSYHTYVNPQRDLPAEVTRITGLTRQFLSDKPLFYQIAKEFQDFVKDSTLIAHNAGFDQKFINSELEIANLEPYADARFKDTLVLARERFPGAYNSLDALCKRFNISLEKRDRHGALIDAELLARVYYELCNNEHKELDIFQKKQSEKAFSRRVKLKRDPINSLRTKEETDLHKQAVKRLETLALEKEGFEKKILWSLYRDKENSDLK